MSARRVTALALGLVLTCGLTACGEKPQTKTERKVDAKAYSGSTVSGYSESGWKAGDRESWELQIRERNKGQNEYAR